MTEEETMDAGALRAAAQEIAEGRWMVEDGETGSTWCFFCDVMPDYPRGKPVERHRDDCSLVILRAALAAARRDPDPVVSAEQDALEYDADYRWLIRTDRLGPNEWGASGIVASEVVPSFGVWAEAMWNNRPAIGAAIRAAEPPALDAERLAALLHWTAAPNHNLGEGPLRAICDSTTSHAPRAAAMLAYLSAESEPS